MADAKREAQRRHWSKTFWLTAVVLAIWFVFAFVVHWYASSLNQSTFLGFPLGYYMAAQGSLFVFVVLIFVQNWLQDGIDDAYERETGQQ